MVGTTPAMLGTNCTMPCTIPTALHPATLPPNPLKCTPAEWGSGQGVKHRKGEKKTLGLKTGLGSGVAVGCGGKPSALALDDIQAAERCLPVNLAPLRVLWE